MLEYVRKYWVLTRRELLQLKMKPSTIHNQYPDVGIISCWGVYHYIDLTVKSPLSLTTLSFLGNYTHSERTLYDIAAEQWAYFLYHQKLGQYELRPLIIQFMPYEFIRTRKNGVRCWGFYTRTYRYNLMRICANRKLQDVERTLAHEFGHMKEHMLKCRYTYFESESKANEYANDYVQYKYLVELT